MKKIAILVAIALIPLCVYAYLADHSGSYDDYQAFSQQYHRHKEGHHNNMMYQHHEEHFGDYRHHHTGAADQFHMENTDDNLGTANGSTGQEAPTEESPKHWHPNYRHING